VSPVCAVSPAAVDPLAIGVFASAETSASGTFSVDPTFFSSAGLLVDFSAVEGAGVELGELDGPLPFTLGLVVFDRSLVSFAGAAGLGGCVGLLSCFPLVLNAGVGV